MSRPSPILIVGSVNTDLVIQGPRLPAPGETVLGGEFFQASGGKGANQAVAAARACREPVTFVAAVGDDPHGHNALTRLRAENLNCEYIRTVSGQPTGVALILVDSVGQNLISVASGANACLRPMDIDRLPESEFRPGRVLLTSLETPIETVKRALGRGRRAGMKTVLNPAPVPAAGLPDELLRLVDVLTPNESEAGALLGGFSVGVGGNDASQFGDVALQLLSRGCRAVVLTLGERGCLVVEPEVTAVPARRVQAVDATAAGDAFNGALAVALSEGQPLVTAAHWATAAAGISVTRRGAQPSLPRRDEIEQLLQR